jgi:CRP/FNR family transcriptional regulator, cyclic AMP receptor protein
MKGQVSAEMLAGFTMLAGIPAAHLQALVQQLRSRWLVPGEVLLARDDPGDDVYFVVSGRLRIIMYSLEGRAVPLRDLGPGETIGELAAIDRLPRSASVEALSAAHVLLLAGEPFRQLVKLEATVANAVLRTAIKYIRDLSDRVFELRSFDATTRIQRELLRLARAAAGDANTVALSPAPRQLDIADRAGSHREAVAREFSKLAKAGLLARRGTTLVVRDIQRLAFEIERE